MDKQIEGQNNFPVWLRIFSFITGFILLSDGMRRFIRPQEARDLYSFMTYVFVGAACLVMCGYYRRLYVNEEGLVRETKIWGRKTKEVLITWNAVERIIYSEQKNTFTACFEKGNKGYRISVAPENKDSLCELVQSFYEKAEE